MPVEDEFLLMMHDTVSIQNATAFTGTGYGVSTLASATTHKAYIEEKRRFVRNEQGTMDEVTHTIYVSGEVRVTAADKITLPDGSSPRIIGAEVWRAEDGSFHHTEILLGRA